MREVLRSIQSEKQLVGETKRQLLGDVDQPLDRRIETDPVEARGRDRHDERGRLDDALHRRHFHPVFETAHRRHRICKTAIERGAEVRDERPIALWKTQILLARSIVVSEPVGDGDLVQRSAVDVAAERVQHRVPGIARTCRVRGPVAWRRIGTHPLLELLECRPGLLLSLGREAKVPELLEPSGGRAVDRRADPLGLDPKAVALGRMHPGTAKIEPVAVPSDGVRSPAEPVQRFDNESVDAPSARLHGSTDPRRAPANDDEAANAAHSTVTLLARFRG